MGINLRDGSRIVMYNYDCQDNRPGGAENGFANKVLYLSICFLGDWI